MKALIKIILIIILVLVGCDHEDNNVDNPEIKPVIIVETMVNDEIIEVDDGYTIEMSCHNNRGPCGAAVWIKVYNVVIEDIELTGEAYTLDCVELPQSDYLLFYVAYEFISSNKIYSGEVKIITDDPYYTDGFIINLAGEKI